ncbi:MAG: beta-lactamase family protein [Ruminococcus sp.]|nr:beta-lactamase family protein [Ruminococcus sp.]
MKQLISATFSVILVALLVFSLASCGDTKFDVSNIQPATEMISVPSAAKDSKSDKKSKSSAKTQKKSSEVSKTVITDPELQALLEKKMNAMNFYGVVRVSKNGKVLCEAANGKLSANSKEDITTDTPFAIASCSKQFTAACIMILKQDGKLSVKDTLDKFFPEFKRGKEVTVKQLLTMRSGLADFLNDNANFSKYNLSKDASEAKNREITRNWIFKHDFKFTPGGAYDYSNTNYFLLAEIVERVTGKTFAKFIKERIFEPLGMNNTDVNEALAYSDRLAVSERDPWDLPGAKGKKIPLTIRVRGLNSGNGGLISTAADIDKWLTSLREYTILSKNSVKEMTTDYNSDSEHYGYGLKIAKNGACWHVGALDYYAAYTYTIPKKGYNFFAVTNDKISMNCDIYTFTSSIINSTK